MIENSQRETNQAPSRVVLSLPGYTQGGKRIQPGESCNSGLYRGRLEVSLSGADWL